MALPTTINAVLGASGHAPPFKSSAGNFYALAKTFPGGNVRHGMFKATDPTDSWTEQDVSGAMNTGGSIIAFGPVSAKQDGDLIHIGALVTGIYSYHTFNMATDLWVIHETIESVGGDTPFSPWISIAVRSNGVPVVVYAGATDRVMGGDKERADFNVRNGGSWDGPIALDPGGDIHYGNPVIVKKDDTDDMFIYWQKTSITDDPPTGWGGNTAAALNTSDVLGTLRDGAFSSTDGALLGLTNAVAYDDAGTSRSASNGGRQGGDFYNQIATISGNDISSITAVSEVNTDEVFIKGEVSLISAVTLDARIWVIYGGGGTSGVDQDVYSAFSDDDGNSYSTPVEELNGITCNFIAANIYVRGADTVLAFIYEDAGNVKYNEKVLIAGAGETASGNPSITAVEASGTVEIIRNANGSPSITAVEASGIAIVRKTASGAAILAAIFAAGTADVPEGETASGNPSITAIEASGIALVRKIANDGAPEIPIITAAGTAEITRNANGSPSLTPIEASGAAIVIKIASDGVPVLTPITASGTATVRKVASGSPSITPVEAAGDVELIRNANGDPSIAPIEAAGTAIVQGVISASGNPAITPIVAAATVDLIRNANGAASITPVEAAGNALIRKQANGTPNITAITAAGVATVRHVASGNATIAAVEAAGTVDLIRNANGSPSIPALEAAGTADVQGGVTASGNPSLTPVEAAGTAVVNKQSSGASTIAAIQASGTVELIRNASGNPVIAAIEAAGNATVGAVETASGNPSLTPIEAAGLATIRKQANGAPILAPLQASGTATIRNTASGAPTLTPIAAAGTANLIHSASGAATIAAITANGNAIVGGAPVFITAELTGYVIDTVFVGYHLPTIDLIGYILTDP